MKSQKICLSVYLSIFLMEGYAFDGSCASRNREVCIDPVSFERGKKIKTSPISVMDFSKQHQKIFGSHFSLDETRTLDGSRDRVLKDDGFFETYNRKTKPFDDQLETFVPNLDKDGAVGKERTRSPVKKTKTEKMSSNLNNDCSESDFSERVFGWENINDLWVKIPHSPTGKTFSPEETHSEAFLLEVQTEKQAESQMIQKIEEMLWLHYRDEEERLYDIHEITEGVYQTLADSLNVSFNHEEALCKMIEIVAGIGRRAVKQKIFKDTLDSVTFCSRIKMRETTSGKERIVDVADVLSQPKFFKRFNAFQIAGIGFLEGYSSERILHCLRFDIERVLVRWQSTPELCQKLSNVLQKMKIS